MKKITSYALTLILFLVFVSGCGGGGSSVDTSVLAKPVASSDTSGNIVVSGTLNLDSKLSNIKTISSVKLSGLDLSLPNDSNCTITSLDIPNNVDVTTATPVNFSATLSGECYENNNLHLSAVETIAFTNGVSTHKNYNYNINYDNEKIHNDYNKLSIKTNQLSNIMSNKNYNFTYQLYNISKGTQISDINTKEVKIETTDSSKIVLVDDKNNEVNSITYTAKPYNKVSFKALKAGNAGIKISAVVKIDNEYVRKVTLVRLSIGETVSNANYIISLDSNNIFSIASNGSIGVSIVRKDDNSTLINNANIHSVTVKFQNRLISFDKTSDIFTYSYAKLAQKNINFYTKTTAGVENIRVDANIFDGEKNVSIQQNLPITIIGGAPHSISLVYKDTSYNNPFFYDTYVIQAVDRYGNPAKEGSQIYLGAINGLVKDSNGNELYVNNGGTIWNDDSNQAELNLTDSRFNFDNVTYQDSVVILSSSSKMNPLYLGGWIVDNVIDNKTLQFNKTYNGIATKNLSFLVGNEKRYDICEKQAKLIDFDSSDNSYTLGKGGKKEVKLRYPSYMVGKDIYLYVNSYDKNRVGTSIRKKLHGTGITASVDTSACTNGKACDIPITFTVKGSNNVLKNENFTLGNFIISSGCNSPTLKISNTQCNGQVIIHVANYSSKCNVNWDKSLNYEH